MRRPVRTLSADVARKIAAGEVIDRPAAIVRELLDNAVDSGADRITVDISGGGIDRIRISDNGSGMTREDLAACARPHATSKIVNADDLLHLSTLGFRGEALASIAACARLSVASGTYRMKASLTEDHLIEEIAPVQNGQGTIVMSEGLFENFPARRVFLKRPATETLLCREIFVEKALARTDIAFRLTIDGSLRADLPAQVSLAERFTRALELKEAPSLFYTLKAQDASWHFTLVIGEPGVRRSDRKQMFIYVNGRRINEYSLLQAIEYGVQGFFPNGTHPVCALFVEIDPALVDFNIHPAKREVRFKDSAGLHHGVSSTVRDFFRAYGIQGARNGSEEKSAQIQPLLSYGAACESSSPRPGNSSPRSESFSPHTASPREASPLTSSLTASSLAEAALQDESVSPPHMLSVAERTSETAGSKNAPGALQPAGSAGGNAHAPDARSRFLHYEQNPAFRYEIAHQAAREKAGADGRFVAAVLDSAGTLQSAAPAVHSTFKSNYTDSPDEDGFRFVGSTLGTFLIAEVGSTLYFIDQHAAHERILFDRLMEGTAEKQELLLPFTIHTETESDDAYLRSIQEPLAKLGFTAEEKQSCSKNEAGIWEFTTIPARWNGTESDLERLLLSEHAPADKVMYTIAAMTACKAAVKDGFVLDRETAADLAKKALALPDPHCPHGRPVWTTLTRGELFGRVRRTE
ncbi:MAG: DNA mismatch repair endonuclease MutL [Treponema sp.]|nr:DNA mismatch repair endonuclease MutL [Treponema sp.]